MLQGCCETLGKLSLTHDGDCKKTNEPHEINFSMLYLSAFSGFLGRNTDIKMKDSLIHFLFVLLYTCWGLPVTLRKQIYFLHKCYCKRFMDKSVHIQA